MNQSIDVFVCLLVCQSERSIKMETCMYPRQMFSYNIFYCSNPRLSPQLTLEREWEFNYDHNPYLYFIINAAEMFKVLYEAEIKFKKEYMKKII